MKKQTKIIATIGPATENKETLVKLYEAGANIARINCSHFEEKEFLKKINNIRDLNNEGKTNFSILLDTKGPEIRTTMMDIPLKIESGDKVIVTIAEFADKFKARLVSDYKYTISDQKVGNIIDIDTGLLSLQIIEKHTDHLVCLAKHSYTVKNTRHINFPGIKLKFPGLTDIDKKHIKIGIQNGIDIVAMSFVRDASNIKEFFEFLDSIDAEKIPVIAKIETLDGVENLDSIIELADGIMVARGDLGAQVPMEKLPTTQECIINKCLEKGKIVIVATNMIESMIENPTPTRAELTDVHNAIKQNVDVTMLSGETAIGKYPIETVSMMSRIISYTEETMKNNHNCFTKDLGDDEDKKQIIKNALFLADDIEASAIVVFTNSGFMGKICGALRPNKPAYAFTFSEETVKRLNMSYAIKPIVIEKSNNKNHLKIAKDYLLNNFILKKGDTVIVLIDGKEKDNESLEMKIIKL